MPPTRQYLPIRPFSRRYRIWDIAPLQRRNSDLLCVSIYPSSSAVADIGHGILPHVGIYLSPFPARNIGYGICPLRVSIYLSAFSHRYRIWEYWILPHVSIYPSPFPARNTGYGICTLRVRIYLSAPSAADIRCGILPHGRRCRIGYGM